ncbi:MAG: DUF928 domain-containing protein [Planktothrix sp.]
MIIIPLPILSLQKNDNNQDFEDEKRVNDVVGGASRGSCFLEANNPRRLTALVPREIRGGTLLENPSLWFYSPYTQSEDTQLQAKFDVLTNERIPLGEVMTIDLPKEPGFFKIVLKDYPLESQAWYNWNLSIECNPQDKGQDIFIQGWIGRIQQESYSGDSDLIWYDQVNGLAQKLCNNPSPNQTLKTEWETLFNSVANQLDNSDRQAWEALIYEFVHCPMY